MDVINHSTKGRCYKCGRAKSYDAPVYEEQLEGPEWDNYNKIRPNGFKHYHKETVELIKEQKRLDYLNNKNRKKSVFERFMNWWVS